jgi:hypothetical protein
MKAYKNTKYFAALAVILFILMSNLSRAQDVTPKRDSIKNKLGKVDAAVFSYNAERFYTFLSDKDQFPTGGLIGNADGPTLFTILNSENINFSVNPADWQDYGFVMKNGRNSDPTFYNSKNNWMRFGSPGGIAIWGDGKQGDNDSPTTLIGPDNVMFSQPLQLKTGSSSIGVVKLLNTHNTGGDKWWLGFDHGPDWSDDNDRARIGAEIQSGGGGNLFFTTGIGKGQMERMRINANGQVGIGTDTKSISSANLNLYNLFVTKGILSENYGLGPQNKWADYVFSNGYSLSSLSEIERFIDQNGHLPNIPEAEKILKEGYSLHDMNVKFLEKIEELTLHLIQKDKEIKDLQQRLSKQEELMAKVAELEKLLLK